MEGITSIELRNDVLYFIASKNNAHATINEKYHRINRIEQAEDGGLSISYLYFMYKTIDSILPPYICSDTYMSYRNGPAIPQIPVWGAIQVWPESRNSPEHKYCLLNFLMCM